MIPLAAVDLVLASSSRYRRELLARIAPGCRQLAPDVDESQLPGEMPAELARRLAEAKARAIAARCPGALVIGSDQVADLAGTLLGKPGSMENAQAQLSACSGRQVVFHTAICLVDARNDPAAVHAETDTTRVFFRGLDDAVIARYIASEAPLDCAGSFKAEGLGITLFERIESVDPTALIGLPLIALCRLLRAAGVDPV